MFLRFEELYGKKLIKLPHFVKKHENSSIWPKTMQLFRRNHHVLVFRWTFQQKVAKSCSIREKARKIIHLAKNFATFRGNYHLFAFRSIFRKKLWKVPHFVEKHEKSSIWPNLYNFPNKLRCLCISINFSEKSCKKCLISWKNTKNHRFGQNLQFFEQATMSWHFHELFRKKLQKVPHFVKKQEKSCISQKLATFRKNYHVFTFRGTLWQKVDKTASFREKARKLIDLAKNYATFSKKPSCFGVSMNFSAKGCKKWLNSWKSTKNHPFGQNFATFRTN